MNIERVAPHAIYPRFAYASSPTYFAWVKITIHDILQLRKRAESGGHDVLFYLNHPIQFVSVIAPIIAIDEIPGRYGLLTIDDGSGATMVVKIRRVAQSVDSPSSTTVPNVNIFSTLARFWVEIDNEAIDVGSVIKAKCTFDSFRGDRQLLLQRASLVKTTREEAEAWLDVARWKLDTLSKPWKLSDEELKTLERQERARVAQMQEEARSKAELRRARARLREKIERRMEKKRDEEHQAMNNGALV